MNLVLHPLTLTTFLPLVGILVILLAVAAGCLGDGDRLGRVLRGKPSLEELEREAAVTREQVEPGVMRDALQEMARTLQQRITQRRTGESPVESASQQGT